MKVMEMRAVKEDDVASLSLILTHTLRSPRLRTRRMMRRRV